MAYTEVQICRFALSYCGTTATISSLTEDSVEAKLCNLHYAPTRDALLEGFAWPFATKYTSPALYEEYEDGDNEASDWAFSYRLPIDCLSVRRIVTANGRAETDPAPFAMGQSVDGPILFTDQEDPVIEYTAKFENPQLYPHSFAKALAWALAAELSFALSVNEQIRQRAITQAAYYRLVAEAVALNAQQPVQEADSAFIRARE